MVDFDRGVVEGLAEVAGKLAGVAGGFADVMEDFKGARGVGSQMRSNGGRATGGGKCSEGSSSPGFNLPSCFSSSRGKYSSK